jgi:hypothetical protein
VRAKVAEDVAAGADAGEEKKVAEVAEPGADAEVPGEAAGEEASEAAGGDAEAASADEDDAAAMPGTKEAEVSLGLIGKRCDDCGGARVAGWPFCEKCLKRRRAESAKGVAEHNAVQYYYEEIRRCEDCNAVKRDAMKRKTTEIYCPLHKGQIAGRVQAILGR